MDFLEHIIPIIVIVLWILGTIGGLLQRALKNAGEKQAPRRGRMVVERGRPAAPASKPDAGDRGRDVDLEEFLATLRGEREPEVVSGKPLAQGAPADREFARPGGEDFRAPQARPAAPPHPARPLRPAAEPEDWTRFPWEPVEEGPQVSPAPRPAPGRAPAARPFTSAASLQDRLVQTPGSPLPPPPAAKEHAPGVEDSLVSPGGGEPAGSEDVRWLSLWEIMQGGRTDRIRGVRLRDAMALREILAPPRAVRPWRPTRHTER